LEIALEESLANASKVQVALKDLQLQTILCSVKTYNIKIPNPAAICSFEIYCILTGRE
jgi:hypothetical protein